MTLLKKIKQLYIFFIKIINLPFKIYKHVKSQTHVINIIEKLEHQQTNLIEKIYQLQEQQTQTNSNLIEKITQLQDQQIKTNLLVKSTNIFIGGLEAAEANVISNQEYFENFEMASIFSGCKESEVDIVRRVQSIPNNLIDGKTVLLIGTCNLLYKKVLYDKGAKKITEIQLTPNSKSTSENKDIFLVHPSQIKNLEIPIHNVMVVSDLLTASLLIKHLFFNLGSIINYGLYITISIDGYSFKSKALNGNLITKENKLIYKDNLVRNLIHKSGFFEVLTQNNKSQKISHFDYHSEIKIKVNTYLKKPNPKTQDTSYIAKKIPEFL